MGEDQLNEGRVEGTPIAAAPMPTLAVSAPVLVIKEAPGHQPSALMKEESPMEKLITIMLILQGELPVRQAQHHDNYMKQLDQLSYQPCRRFIST